MKEKSELWTAKPCWTLTILFFGLNLIGITPKHVLVFAELALNVAANKINAALW